MISAPFAGISGHFTRLLLLGLLLGSQFADDLLGVGPPRPDGTFSLSFTTDGKTLYAVIVDEGVTFQTSRLVKVDVASGSFEVVTDDLGGPGGSIAPASCSSAVPRAPPRSARISATRRPRRSTRRQTRSSRRPCARPSATARC